jgi:hypothetical protein
MPDYETWNTAIIDFFTYDIRKGKGVYLTVNHKTLQDIGKSYLDLDSEIAISKFINAVKEKCIKHENGVKHVSLTSLRTNDAEGKPLGVAFLSAMVLAAYQMSGKDEIDNTNYFKRLCELLDVVQCGQGSRPLGMELDHNADEDRGAEVSLWLTWNAWLESKGLAFTARPVKEGPLRYLNYTIEQSLLRSDDVEFLQKVFSSHLIIPEAIRSLDETQLRDWMLRQHFNRRHLRAGLESPDVDRASAFFDEAYEVYRIWGQSKENDGEAFASRRLNAGIQRRSFKGLVSYWLLPRRPIRWKTVQLKVINFDGESKILEPYRDGLFEPIWPIEPFVDTAKSFLVEGDDTIRDIIFPKRDFWILTPDPEDKYGLYATWEKYPTGNEKKYLILLKGNADSKLSTQMRIFKEYKLLDWDSEPQIKDGWVEYHGCMVLSSAWDCINPIPEAEEFFHSLKPKENVTASLSGGLKAPQQAAWLVDYPPSLILHGFEKNFKVIVKLGNNELKKETVEAQNLFSLSVCKDPGMYNIEVMWDNKLVANRSLKIISWDDISANTIDCVKWVEIGKNKICGPLIQNEEVLHVRC